MKRLNAASAPDQAMRSARALHLAGPPASRAEAWGARNYRPHRRQALRSPAPGAQEACRNRFRSAETAGVVWMLTRQATRNLMYVDRLLSISFFHARWAEEQCRLRTLPQLTEALKSGACRPSPGPSPTPRSSS